MSLPDALLYQARACSALGSPFMGRMLTLLAENWPHNTDLGRLCAQWPGEIGPHAASLPLRIAGGLHALVLTGRDTALKQVYPPVSAPDSDLIDTVLAALERHQSFMLDWIQSAPQTNEVRRSAALIPAAHWIAGRFSMPFVTSELGASAGLNLAWDQYAVQAGGQRYGPPNPALTLKPDWTGLPPAPATVTVNQRRGVDLNPLDPHDPDQALRLLSYLWPDQPHRRALTKAAITARNGTVDRGDAIDWLETRLTQIPAGHLHLIYHTIAWQYFPDDGQRRGTRIIEMAGAQATDSAPLAWLRMESDGDKTGAALTLRLWPGDLHISLGRADFHGRWVQWQAPQTPGTAAV